MYRILHLELNLNIMSEQAKVLFFNLELSFQELIDLSYDDDNGDLLSYKSAYLSAMKYYAKSLNELKDYVKTTELRAQAGGFM
jgi:hypothetical protein